MSSIKFICITFCFLLLPSGVGAKSLNISESEFGDEWPFTVDEGVLNCSGNEVTFVVDGLEYAVNGRATNAGYSPIEPIWKYNLALIAETAEALDITIEEVKETSPFRISIGPITEAGLALCSR